MFTEDTEESGQKAVPLLPTIDRRDLLAYVRGQLAASKRKPNTPELNEMREQLKVAGRNLSGLSMNAVDAEATRQIILAHAMLVGCSPNLMAAAPRFMCEGEVEFSSD